MKFVDEVLIEIRSGNGGPGAVNFMRQKYRPKMGPDGGDGGRGGSLYFEATHDMQSLLDFKFRPKFEAQDGEKGGRYNRNGKDGENLTVKVPVGTMLFDAETGQFLADLVKPGESLLVLKGGRGGLGNMNFATAVRQAPDFAQPGETGSTRRVRMELKLMADIGLVGFPNAGKSTLISSLSAARPKVADYPFTTLVPNLGVVRGKSLDFVLADIPGIIEGAHEGKGLGVQFLKHCERTRGLVILLDLDTQTGRSLESEYNILEREMREFSEDLGHKPRLIAINKTDLFGGGQDKALLDEALLEKDFAGLKARLERDGRDPKEIIFISAASQDGLPRLVESIESLLRTLGPREIKNEVGEVLELGDPGLFERDGQSAMDPEADDADFAMEIDPDADDPEESEG
jgi:GTP-binding protein